MPSEAASSDICLRCSRNRASRRIKVFVGKLSLRASGDNVERYEGTTLELPVCTWCYRLYHLRDDLEGYVMWLVLIVPIGYGIWAYATNRNMIIAYVIGSFLFMMLMVGLFMTAVSGKILRWFFGPARFVRKHPDYLEFRERGLTEVFYVDRKGSPESKLTMEVEDLQ